MLDNPLYLVFVLVLAYLAGSIPSAVWFGKWLKGIDVREHGSGNAGLTNAIRVMGFKASIPVLIVDLSKGILPPVLARGLGLPEWAAVAAGLLAVLGHSFTCFAGFRGGKGVLTAFGVFLALAPLEALSAFVVWAILLKTTKYMSLASIAACVVLMAVGSVHFFVFPPLDAFIYGLMLLVGIFVIIKHKDNIKRLLNGTENKMGAKKVSEA